VGSNSTFTPFSLSLFFFLFQNLEKSSDIILKKATKQTELPQAPEAEDFQDNTEQTLN
jgi:hypothetical protein